MPTHLPRLAYPAERESVGRDSAIEAARGRDAVDLRRRFRVSGGSRQATTRRGGSRDVRQEVALGESPVLRCLHARH
jgi:hypothetical protein